MIRVPALLPEILALALIAGLSDEATAQTGEITATENERLRIYAQDVKNDRDGKEAEIATLKVLLEKYRQALLSAQKTIERLQQGGKEQ